MEFSLTPPSDYEGSTSLDVAIRVIGKSENGERDIQINLKVPEPKSNDGICSQSEIEAVRDLFPHVPDTITSMQAYAIICYSEYARSFVSLVLSASPPGNQDLWLRMIATLVSHDDRVSEAVISWAEARQKLGSARMTAKEMIYFHDLITISMAIENELRD